MLAPSEQPPTVQAILGGDGEALAGPLAKLEKPITRLPDKNGVWSDLATPITAKVVEYVRFFDVQPNSDGAPRNADVP
jgi:hypothetical protein